MRKEVRDAGECQDEEVFGCRERGQIRSRQVPQGEVQTRMRIH